MEGKFVYVFSEEARDAMRANHYILFKSNEAQHMYIFLNKERLAFSDRSGLPDVTYVVSDTLTF